MPDNPQLRDIFDRAVELPSGDRPSFLDSVCGGDAGLRAEVESLLRSLEGAADFTIGSIDSDVAASPPGQVGPYTLIERIGEGGMGVVYSAEQSQPVRRSVAVKIIKPGMDTAAVIARFDAERQALALMDHTNIARIYDAGTTDSGRPYFVMELVRGVPITRYCDEHLLSPRQRLELFVPVCRAVQHAHQKGVVHRDLKPGNVLVAVEDGRPLAKVIDFGIAKAVDPLQPGMGPQTLLGPMGLAVGTPEYMSPEQAGRADVDTRSDVYALGVILYELLTGGTPIDRKALRQAGHEAMLRAIREAEPPKPSTRLSTAGQAAAVATLRQTDPRKLARLLAGDLDCVVMKCLEKDRARRYDSANDLARDVERFLNDEPVEATPPSRLLTLRRTAWHHRRAVALTTGVAAMLVVSCLATLFWVLKTKASTQRDIAVIARSDAEESRREETAAKEAAQRAENGRRYTASIFAAADAVANDNLATADRFLNKAPAALRNWEWAYLHAASNLQLLTIDAPPPQSAENATYIRHGTEICIIYKDRTSRSFDAVTGRVVRDVPAPSDGRVPLAVSDDGRQVLEAGHGSVVVTRDDGSRTTYPFAPDAYPYQARFSPDGRQFVVLTVGSGAVWTGTGTGVTGRLNKLVGHRVDVHSSQFSRDGTKLVTGDIGGISKVWNTSDGNCISTYVNPDGHLMYSCFNPDGTQVASSTEGTARPGMIWGAADGKERRSLVGEHPDPDIFSEYSPDGKLIAICGGPFAMLFDAVTGKPVRTFRGHHARVHQVHFDDDGSRLLTVSNDYSLRVWDVCNLPRPMVFGTDAPLTSAETTADGLSLIATGIGGGVRIYDRATGSLRNRFDGPALASKGALSSGRFDPASTHVAVPAGDGTFFVLDAATAAVVSKIGDPTPVMTRLVTSSIPPGLRPIAPVAFTHDGRRAFTITSGGVIREWDLATGTAVRTISTGVDAIDQIIISPTDDRIIVADSHQAAIGHLWDVPGGTRIGELRHGKAISSFAFSHNGKYVLTTSLDHSVDIWDAVGGKKITVLWVKHNEVQSAAFNPTDSRVVVCCRDDVAEVWDATTFQEIVRRPLFTLSGHEGCVLSGSYSPDGTRIVTSSADGTACVWDAANGDRLLTLRGHTGPVSRAEFTPDGNAILTMSDDGTARLWEGTSNEQIAARGRQPIAGKWTSGRSPPPVAQ